MKASGHLPELFSSINNIRLKGFFDSKNKAALYPKRQPLDRYQKASKENALLDIPYLTVEHYQLTKPLNPKAKVGLHTAWPSHIQFIRYPDGTYWTDCNWKGPLPAQISKDEWGTIFRKDRPYKFGEPETVWHSPINYKTDPPKIVDYIHYHDHHLWTDCKWEGPMPATLKEKRTDKEIRKYMADGSIWKTKIVTPPSTVKSPDINANVLERVGSTNGGGYYREYMSDGTVVNLRG